MVGHRSFYDYRPQGRLSAFQPWATELHRTDSGVAGNAVATGPYDFAFRCERARRQGTPTLARAEHLVELGQGTDVCKSPTPCVKRQKRCLH